MRLLLELVGLVLAAAAQVGVCLVYLIGASLRTFADHQVAYWSVIGAGYLGIVLVLATAKVTVGPQVTSRQLLDIFLRTFFWMLLIAAVFMHLNWPISLRGWDGHGMGATGGEGNMILLPWMHWISILCVGRAMLAVQRRRQAAVQSHIEQSAD